jgi:hypothetical protein
MQNTFSINCNWTKSILNGTGWEIADELFEALRNLPDWTFSENGLPTKTDFITGLRKLIVSIELDGDSVKEAKQMTAPGSILESLSSDYLFIRGRYVQKRKKLKQQLLQINSFISGYN